LTGKEDSIDESIDMLVKMMQREQEKIYSKKVIAEFNDPKNLGRMADSDALGIVNGTCGDTIEIYIKVEDEKITEISFMTDGCGATIASASMLTRMAKGKTLAEANSISGDNLIFELDGLPDEHMHCPHLAVAALRKAVLNFNAPDRE